MLKRFACALSLGLLVAAGPISCAAHSSTPQAPQTPAAAPAPAPAPAPSRPASTSAASPVAAAALPQRLSDRDFWQLSTDLSEPNGSFRSDNLLSNEVWL